ncbi:hypothetical protein CH352_02805 [Leptospira hartskeerlii]|uniref:Uncharacterized protein n=1 Tax=Leptospira hartskeerlii TaxID=2023177 RepID=A0A2M9XD47_9LEPT|nr:hypothetical protein [Leptospira hartskeerlii]PJZ25625.1 hypothetical protein CH357_08175 [Leptospira hartskeerlii]PJZ35552.1 hypothetical protein CH352_02805 [Leptospira hartskeerlii]
MLSFKMETMDWRFRSLLVLSVSFLCLGCLKTFPVLEEPAPGKEGLVAFGLIVAQGGISNGIFKGLAESVPKETYISSVSGNDFRINLADPGKEMEGEGNYRFLWVQKLLMGKSENAAPKYFAISRLPQNQSLILDKASYTYTTTHTYTTVDKYGHVQVHTYTVSHDQSIWIEYDPLEKSKFSFYNPGGLEIRFLGNFIAHPKGINFSFGGPYTGTYVLTNIDTYLKENPDLTSDLKNKFYGKEEINAKGAEIHFLKRFIKENRSRYWQDIAIKKLFRLDPKTREAAIKAKIPIPAQDLSSENPIQQN